MTDWQQRVVDECEELYAKHQRLGQFIDGDSFDLLEREDRALLLQQAILMKSYLDVLRKRIVRFSTKQTHFRGSDKVDFTGS